MVRRLLLLLGLVACGPTALPPQPSHTASLPAPTLPAPPKPAPRPLQLRFITDFNLATGTRFEDVEVGGLSGLCFADGMVLALSDDRAERGPARLYRLSVRIGKALEVAVQGVVALSGPDGPFEKGSVDPEALARAPGGGLLVGTEGDTRPEPRIPPRIHHVAPDGSHLGLVPLPEAFLPEPRGQQTRGVRFNKGIESLSTAPSGHFFFAANEQALVQDGDVASFDAGTEVRVLRYGDRRTLVSQYRYRTDAIAKPDGDATDSSLGVSDMVALDDDRLLLMERSFVATEHVAGNRIRLYEVDLRAAPDADGLLVKRLVLDLDDIVPQLDPAFPRLDNLEGAALGPRLESGERSLLLVSDNNFKQPQRTLMLAFALEE